MRYEIPAGNWTTALADAIKDASDGDTIVCHTENMRALAERARLRMCPDKALVYEVIESVF
jgi:hypothetical protein